MSFFDWLLGNSRLGSLKFLLLSLLFGGFAFFLLDGVMPDSNDYGRFLVVGAGVGPLLLLRWAYWSFRRKQLWRWVRAGSRKAMVPIMSLFQNRPSLVAEFQPIIAIYQKHLRPPTQPAGDVQVDL